MYGNRKKTGVIEIERNRIGASPGSPITGNGLQKIVMNVADYPELEGLDPDTDTVALWIDPETPTYAG